MNINKNKQIALEAIFSLVLILAFYYVDESIGLVLSTIMFFVMIPAIGLISSCVYILITFNSKTTTLQLERNKKNFKKFLLLSRLEHLFLLSLQTILFYTILNSGFVFIAYYIFITYVAYIAVSRTFVSRINDYYLLGETK